MHQRVTEFWDLTDLENGINSQGTGPSAVLRATLRDAISMLCLRGGITQRCT